MLRAWRERDQEKRIKIAYQAVEHNPRYVIFEKKVVKPNLMLQTPFGPEKILVSASFLRGFIYGINMYDLGPIKLSVVQYYYCAPTANKAFHTFTLFKIGSLSCTE